MRCFFPLLYEYFIPYEVIPESRAVIQEQAILADNEGYAGNAVNYV